MILTVTGHRPHVIGGYGPSEVQTWIRQQLRDVLTAVRDVAGPSGVMAMTGMALGVDQWFFEEALVVGVPVWAAVPFSGQERIWPEASQKHYRELLKRAARVDGLSTAVPANREVAAKLLLGRNTWMVEQATAAVAVWNGAQSGGTADCVRKIKAKGLLLYHINPTSREVRICPSESPTVS